MKQVRELWDAEFGLRRTAGSGVALPAAAPPDNPTTAATGVALPAAATPGEPQLTTEDRATLTQRFNTDNLFRAEVIGAQQLLSRSLGSIMKIDEICSKPGSMPLRILFEDALRAQEHDMLSAQLMFEILQGFATEADVSAANSKAMAGALPQTVPARSVHGIKNKIAEKQERFELSEVEADYDID